MEALTLKEIAQAVGGTTGGCGASQLRVSAISTDHRTLSPSSSSSSSTSDPAGALFVAISGPRFDGHDFVGDAAERGAAAALVHRTVGAPAGLPLVKVDDTTEALGRLAHHVRGQARGPVVAITGSVGNTL